MHDSTLSYHAERRVDGVYTSHGEQTLLTQLVSVDVSGTDYSASTSITTTDPSGATTQSAFKVVALGDSMFVRLGTDPWEKTARSSAEPPANPFRRLNENELTFMGMTDEDLFEFDIRIWIGESPASFEEPPEQPAAMTAFYLGDHKTSVLVDSSGVPHALFSEYAVRTVIDAIPGTERFVEEYTRVGEAIRIEAPTDAHTAALAVPMTIPPSRAHAFPSPRIGLLGY